MNVDIPNHDVNSMCLKKWKSRTKVMERFFRRQAPQAQLLIGDSRAELLIWLLYPRVDPIIAATNAGIEGVLVCFEEFRLLVNPITFHDVEDHHFLDLDLKLASLLG